MSVGLLKNDGSPTAPSSDALSATLRLAPLRHSFPAYMRLLTSACTFFRLLTSPRASLLHVVGFQMCPNCPFKHVKHCVPQRIPFS